MKETNMIDLTHEYKSWISELKTRYKQAQIKASVAVNGELLKFYFDLGKDLLTICAGFLGDIMYR